AAYRFGFIAREHRWGKVLTSMFVHGGWGHLLGNLYVFALAAPFLEDVFGRLLFTGLYLAGGAVAVLAGFCLAPDSARPLTGASGAIAALMGAFLVRFGTTRIRFAYWIPFLWPMEILAEKVKGAQRLCRGTIPAPAWLVLPLW